MVNQAEIPYLEFSKELVIQHVKQIVGFQGPNTVSTLLCVLGHDFGVKFIEFYKIWPLQNEICEKFSSFCLPLF